MDGAHPLLSGACYYLSIIAYLTHVKFDVRYTKIKDNMNIKKVIPTISDVDTGEILYQLKHSENDYFSYKTFNIGDFDKTGESFCRMVFDSFLRGVKTGRNLCLMITVKDIEVPREKDIF